MFSSPHRFPVPPRATQLYAQRAASQAAAAAAAAAEGEEEEEEEEEAAAEAHMCLVGQHPLGG
jgi:hypothetical protein